MTTFRFSLQEALGIGITEILHFRYFLDNCLSSIMRKINAFFKSIAIHFEKLE